MVIKLWFCSEAWIQTLEGGGKENTERLQVWGSAPDFPTDVAWRHQANSLAHDNKEGGIFLFD